MAEVVPIRPNKQQRFTSKATKGTNSERATFRCDQVIMHEIDVMVQSGFDPEIQTKSDALSDGAYNWVIQNREAYKRHVAGQHSSDFDIFVEEWTREARANEIAAFERQVKYHKEAENWDYMRQILVMIYSLKNRLNADQFGDKKQKKLVNDLITEVTPLAKKYDD